MHNKLSEFCIISFETSTVCRFGMQTLEKKTPKKRVKTRNASIPRANFQKKLPITATTAVPNGARFIITAVPTR